MEAEQVIEVFISDAILTKLIAHAYFSTLNLSKSFLHKEKHAESFTEYQ
jgi:hypothetical protein